MIIPFCIRTVCVRLYRRLIYTTAPVNAYPAPLLVKNLTRKSTGQIGSLSAAKTVHTHRHHNGNRHVADSCSRNGTGTCCYRERTVFPRTSNTAYQPILGGVCEPYRLSRSARHVSLVSQANPIPA